MLNKYALHSLLTTLATFAIAIAITFPPGS